MAVDFFHYLIVSGPFRDVRDFSDRIALVERRRVAGQTQKETIPFSFESLWAMISIKEEMPGEGFDLTRWGPVRRGREAEVRYRFHTRSVEMHPLLKRLSKRFPQLTFALVTHCLDDGDFGAFTIQDGRRRGKWLGDDWRTPFWERAAKHFKVPLDETWDDPSIESVAESWMRDAAVRIATGSDRDYRWTDGPVARDFETERFSSLVEFGRALHTAEEQEASENRRRQRKPRGRSRKKR